MGAGIAFKVGTGGMGVVVATRFTSVSTVVGAPIPSPKNAEIRTRFEKYATMRIEAPSQRMSASSQKSAARPHRSSRRALASQAAGGRPSTASDGSSHMAA